MKLEQMKTGLQTERDAFALRVKDANTLERNVLLAVHRNEIARLEKLIAKQER